LLNALIGLPISDVEDDHAAISTAVEGVTQGLEPLLARCVPDLEGHRLSRLGLHLLLDEVGADRWLLTNAGPLVLIALNQARFANTGVPNHNDLKELLTFTAICY
jgi:hypothetical protein